jgi:hypothetical protein
MSLHGTFIIFKYIASSMTRKNGLGPKLNDKEISSFKINIGSVFI